jgi:hypothetical protein
MLYFWWPSPSRECKKRAPPPSKLTNQKGALNFHNCSLFSSISVYLAIYCSSDDIAH